MASGFFLGGAAQGVASGLDAAANVQYTQIQQQRLQQLQQNQDRNFYTEMADKFINNAKISLQSIMDSDAAAHPETPIQTIIAESRKKFLAEGGFTHGMGLVQTMYSKLGIDPAIPQAMFTNTISSVVPQAALEASAARSKAQATGEFQEKTARARYYERGGLPAEEPELTQNKRTAGGQPVDPNNPDLDQDKQLGGPGQKVAQAQQPQQPAETDRGKTLLSGLARRGGMQPEELDVLGRARASGNSGVLQNLGRGKQGGEAVKAVNAWATYTLMHEGNLSAAEAAQKLNDNTVNFAANRTATTSGAQTAARREANLGIILNTVKTAIPAALAASNAVPRTQWVPVNQAIQDAKKAGSSPELKVFAQKNLQVAELWAKAMNPSGVMRNEDRELALGILNTADSQETYRAALTSLTESIGLEEEAAESYLKERGLGGVIKKNPGALSGGGGGGGKTKPASEMSDDELKKSLGIK